MKTSDETDEIKAKTFNDKKKLKFACSYLNNKKIKI